MPYQVDDALRHAMSGTELSRVRTELRLLLREHINHRLLASRGADIVMQSSGIHYSFLASNSDSAVQIRVQLRPKSGVLGAMSGRKASKANCTYGAGDGNRTHVRSLGSFYTAIVRRPLIPLVC
jgi:hypothetical protein